MPLNADGQEDWRRVSPLSVVFFIGRILKTLAKNALQSVAPIAAFAIAAEGPVALNALLGAAILGAGLVAVGILRWVFFRYRIDERSILVRDGVFIKTQLDIEFGRIQAVNTRQNILYRPAGLVDVLLDTAGSSEQEGFIPGVPAPLAVDLESRLRDSRDLNYDRAPDEPVEERVAVPPIIEYDWADLVKIGITSNRALVFLAVLAPFVERLFETLGRRMIEQGSLGAASQVAEIGLLALSALVLLFAGLVLLFLAASSIVAAILRYYDYRLTASEHRLNARGGLLTRHEHSVRFSKIQALYLHENPVQRMLEVVRFQARQAASGKESEQKSLTVPLMRHSEMAEVTEICLPGEYPELDLAPRAAGFARVHPHFVRSRFVLYGLLPALAATAWFAPALEAYALVALAWIPLAWPVWLRVYRCLGVKTGSDGLCLRTGFLGFRVVGLLYRKVQRVTLTQSWFQRRRKLATMRLYLASGSLRIPYVPLADAERLRDYILYRVEIDERAWA